MGIAKVRASLTGLSPRDMRRATHKNMRGARKVIGPFLDPGERLIAFFKMDAREGVDAHYIWLTSTFLRISRFAGDGEINSFQHEALAGLRIRGEFVRLAYIFGASDTVRFPTFLIDGGPAERLVFITQFSKAWATHMGRRFPNEFFDADIVAKFSFED